MLVEREEEERIFPSPTGRDRIIRRDNPTGMAYSPRRKTKDLGSTSTITSTTSLERVRMLQALPYSIHYFPLPLPCAVCSRVVSYLVQYHHRAWQSTKYVDALVWCKLVFLAMIDSVDETHSERSTPIALTFEGSRSSNPIPNPHVFCGGREANTSRLSCTGKWSQMPV